MLLKDTLIQAGDFCFRHRTMQFILYMFIFLLNINAFNHIHESVLFEFICFGVTLTGIIIRILTIGYVPRNTSGRNRHEQIAETLNTTGMYSIVRNPLYVGNFFIFLGIAMMSESIAIIVESSILMLIFYSLIVLKEEDFLHLKFGVDYENWIKKIPCFIPSFKNYKKSGRDFSWKKVIINEHDTWLSTLICFIGIEILKGWFEVNRFELLPIWINISLSVFLIWAISKVLKKKHILDPLNLL